MVGHVGQAEVGVDGRRGRDQVGTQLCRQRRRRRRDVARAQRSAHLIFLGFFVFVLKPFFPLFCKLIFFFDFIFPRISNCRYCYPSTLPTG